MPSLTAAHYWQRVAFRMFNYLAWLHLILFSFLIVYNTIPYFSFNKNFAFIQERAILFLQPIYGPCFYIHIFAGMLCIATAIIQCSKILLKKFNHLHVVSGRVYVVAVLLLGAPTGMYMSFFAKGSAAEKGLFMFMALSWFFFTAKGLQAILEKKIVAHKYWMWRSYAMSLTAVTFRVYYLILYLYDVPLMLNYEVSLWLSVIGNLIAVEIIILMKSKAFNHTKNQANQTLNFKIEET